MKFLLRILNLLWLVLLNSSLYINAQHFYCTAADQRHFILLQNLIGSIHCVDFDHLGEIAVFDLGFTPEQRQQLSKYAKVYVYDVELVHPELLHPFLTSPQGRRVRGWFAWKPVIIKQALDLFPYVLYLDAGATVLHSPTNLFKHIQAQGYFLMDTGPHSIAERATKTVISQLIHPLPESQQAFLLAPTTLMISPGLQGLSRVVYHNYVLPMYETAKHLELYVDDGSSIFGFGAGRHDQPIFSIYAYLNQMQIHPQGWAELLVDGRVVRQHIHWDVREVNDQTIIYQSRWNYRYGGGYSQFLLSKI